MLAGTRRVLESARKLLGATWGDEGTTRIQHAWTADPDLIRRFTTGQACYIRRGSATFVQIARPRPSPIPLPAAPPRPVVRVPPPPVPRSRLSGQDGPPTLPLPAVPGPSPAGHGGRGGPLDDVLGPATDSPGAP